MEVQKMLPERVADDIVSMIQIDKRFHPGDKLPNENVLSQELMVSRATLREAIRILTARGILEIQRGKGTFVKNPLPHTGDLGFLKLSKAHVNARDLYEMRLIFEPQAAYFAALRATESELKRILQHGKQIEEKIQKGEDRTKEEQAFHKAIATATHNEIMHQLQPILYSAINEGVVLSEDNLEVVADTLNDHRMIMEFLKNRDAEGAKTAMKLHMLHAMRKLGME